MDDAAIHALNEINRRFYETVAADFDATRQQAWQGWERVAEFIEAASKPASTQLSMLDVGCGNGRFGVFLAERLGKERLRYVGIDSSTALLDRARQVFAVRSGIDAHFERRDLIEQSLDASFGQFDLVVLFGVLHHIPGATRRLALLRSLAARVEAGGLLVFTEWRFLEAPAESRFRERIVPWNDVPWGENIQVEPGDYLLDWRRGGQPEIAPALRYCHYVDDAEHAQLVAATGLAMVAEYRADAANLYTVLRKDA
jgi:SAM-dependent methyltransferase